MYSVHGWATIWPSYKNDNSVDDLLDDDKMNALRQKIADHIQQLGLGRTEEGINNPFAEIRPLNNETHLWLSGNNNHAVWHETIMEVFTYVAVLRRAHTACYMSRMMRILSIRTTSECGCLLAARS